uniref:Stigma-specific STIG1-like protein 1 n=1 Tax=Manihot esculenta TaxID=3983 RepID=A0A2C9W761_MANES
MKLLLKAFFIIVVAVMALAISAAALTLQEEQDQEGADMDYGDETSEFSAEHRFGRILIQRKRKARARMSCKKFPRICHAKGSPGPYCCKKKCVNVLRDRFNCGACGKKCKYNQICCNGKCVNPSFNRRHCGGCNNKCKNGSFCAFGLCNYA